MISTIGSLWGRVLTGDAALVVFGHVVPLLRQGLAKFADIPGRHPLGQLAGGGQSAALDHAPDGR